MPGLHFGGPGTVTFINAGKGDASRQPRAEPNTGTMIRSSVSPAQTLHDALFGPPALRTTRRQRIASRPVVYLTAGELVYAECYDAAEAHGHPADAIQAIFDAYHARGEAPVVVIEAGPVACAVADPRPLYDAAPAPRRTRRAA